jgi:hypothetical protein
MSKIETARQLAAQTILQKQGTENSLQPENQLKDKPQKEDNQALLVQTLA